jgi:hypothetical protein
MLSDVPPVITDHIRTAMRARALPRTAIARYDISGTRIRHQKLLRACPDIRPFDADETAWIADLASGEARLLRSSCCLALPFRRRASRTAKPPRFSVRTHRGSGP